MLPFIFNPVKMRAKSSFNPERITAINELKAKWIAKQQKKQQNLLPLDVRAPKKMQNLTPTAAGKFPNQAN